MVTDYLPAELEELTPEWLTQVLREQGSLRQAAVTSVESEVLGEGRGFTGRVVRLRLGYDVPGSGPESLVAKLPATDPAIRAYLITHGLYEREYGFYTEIAATPGLPVPRSYYAGINPEGATMLLLEDVAQARPGDNVNGCSDEDAFLVVSRLARLHAAWWEHPRLGEMTWLVPIDQDKFQETLQQLLPTLLARFGDALPVRLQDLAGRLANNYSTWRKHLDGPPRTIVHSDLRLDNLLFGLPDTDDSLTIIDWQLPILWRGVADVSYFAAFCLHKKQRRAIERRMIEIYHGTLLADGVHGYDLDQCLRDYSAGTITALSRLISAGAMLDFSSERGKALVAVLIDRIDAILADHNVAELLST